MMKELTLWDIRVNPGDGGFLVDNSETVVLCDTCFGFNGGALRDKLKKYLGERRPDCVLLTHSHYDHILGSIALRREWPDMKVLAGRKTAAVFERAGALRRIKEMDDKAAKRCGAEPSADSPEELHVDRIIEEDESFSVGTLTFRMIPMPGHTNCSVGYYCEEHALLLGCETLGVYDGMELIVPAYLTGIRDTLESIDRVKKLHIEKMVIPHYGLVSGARLEYYLEHMRESVTASVEFLGERIRKGLTKEQITEEFKQKYRPEHIAETYPEDAANLNVSIMIELIKKEYPEYLGNS